MFRGALISNAFLRTGKFVEHYEWLKKAAERQGIVLSLFDNTKLSVMMESRELTQGWDWLEGLDFIIYWEKDIPGGKFLEDICRERGIAVYNSMNAIACCDHKFFTYEKIWAWNRKHNAEQQIPLLPTVMAPMTYENIGYSNLDFLENIILQLGLPVIIKECFGSFGMQVYRADTREEAAALTEKLAGKPFLYQKYWECSRGRDVRIQVVGGKVVAAMHRYSEQGDFRANLTNGGSMKTYQPSEEECRIAIQTCEILGLDFAGVDLLFNHTGRATILCEVNSNAHFKNIYTCTGVNVAECIVAYIREQLGK